MWGNDNCINKKKDYCLLTKNAITSNPETLAIISVIKIDFPNFYQDLIKEPKLLKAVLWQFLGVDSCKIILSEPLIKMLKKYAGIKEQEAFIKDNKKFSTEYSRLKNYLASVKRVNLPESISPFILLVQDSITREIGSDDAEPLYNALVSENKEDVYSILDIKEDDPNNKLNEMQTKLVYKVRNIIETKEIDERKIKADCALITFVDKLTGEYVRYVANELSMRLSFDINLSKLIGANEISKLLLSKQLDNDNINLLFSKILENIQNKQLYSDDKKNNMNWFISIAEVGLKLSYDFKVLENDLKTNLLKLIKFRQFPYKEKSAKTNLIEEVNCLLPFSFYKDLEKTFKEDFLLDMNFNYIHDLLNEIHEENNVIEIDEAIKQIKFIFDNYKVSDSLKHLYFEQVVICISHKNEKVVNFIINYIKENNILEKARDEYIDHIISSFIQRLDKHLAKGSKNEPLSNFSELANYLMNLLNKYCNLIKNIDKYETGRFLALFTFSCSKSKDAIDFVEKLVEIGFNTYLVTFNRVLEGLINTLFVDVNEEGFLNENLIKLISSKYIEDHDSEDNNYKYLKEIIKQLESNIENDTEELAKDIYKNYKIFMENLSEKAKNNKIITSHLSNIYSILEEALEQEQLEYFNQIFTIVVDLFSYKIDSNLDSLLLKIKTDHLDAVTDLTNDLYILFTNKWPNVDSSNLPNYNPQEIFKNTAKEYVEEYNKDLDSITIFKSIYSMYKKTVVANNSDNQSILVSCAFELWKIDTDFAYGIFEEFPNAASDYNYEILYSRNATNNPEPLNKIWTLLMKNSCNKDKNTLIKRTGTFLKNENYLNNEYMPLWFKCLYNELNDLDILNKAILNILSSNKDSEYDFLLENREKINKLIKKEFNNDIKLRESLAKDLLSFYLDSSDGNIKLRVARWMRDLTDKNASNIINKRTVSEKTSKQYKKDIISLKKIFDENAPLVKMLKEITAQKKTKRRNNHG